jgi:hypothetical protein
VISWWLGYKQGMRPTLMLESILLTLEKSGAVELVRDKSGRITGGRNVTVQGTGVSMKMTLGTITQSGGDPQVGG